MKKVFLFVFMALVTPVIFTACDNLENTTLEIDYSEGGQDAIGEVVSFADWVDSDTVSYDGWERSSRNASTRIVSNSYTVKGYTEKSSAGTKKVSISQNLALLLGIKKQIYVMETVTARYNLTIDGLNTNKVIFVPEDSPQCGLFPDSKEDEYDLRGYSSSVKGDNVVMASKMIHVISDLAGHSYDKWFPCKPEQLEWTYNVINLE